MILLYLLMRDMIKLLVLVIGALAKLFVLVCIGIYRAVEWAIEVYENNKGEDAPHDH